MFDRRERLCMRPRRDENLGGELARGLERAVQIENRLIDAADARHDPRKDEQVAGTLTHRAE
jgi:hypothetical protein